MEYLLLLIGFLLLVKGADFFVEGASTVARLLRVPSVIIGLTIVAMGTSAPEASVSITAGLQQNNDIALGNILGSNLFNLLFIVGICAVIKSSHADKEIVSRDLPVSICAVLITILCALDGTLVLWEGLLMLGFMAVYLGALLVPAIRKAKCDSTVCFDAMGAATLAVKTRNAPAPALATDKRGKTIAWIKNLLFVGGGLTAVIFGGQMVVDSAIVIAKSLGLSESVIALTVVAIGTSLPELVTSITAARKGDSGLALGNVVGSNIFNILFILGFSTALSPIGVDTFSLIDAAILAVVSLLAFVWYAVSRRSGKILGLAFIALYVGYTAYILLR